MISIMFSLGKYARRIGNSFSQFLAVGSYGLESREYVGASLQSRNQGIVGNPGLGFCLSGGAWLLGSLLGDSCLERVWVYVIAPKGQIRLGESKLPDSNSENPQAEAPNHTFAKPLLYTVSSILAIIMWLLPCTAAVGLF